MKIGVQLYTLRNYLKKQSDFPGVFERVRAMGAETVQISGTGEFDVKFLRKVLDDTGLSVCVTHSPFARIKNDLERLIEEHSEFGCFRIGVGIFPPEFDKKDADDIKRFADTINAAAAKLEAYKMTIAYHNHGFEFNKVKNTSKTLFDILLENFKPSVEFIPDTFWLRLKKMDIVSFLENLKGRISVIHLKDYRRRFAPMMLPVGDGVLDFKAILEAARVCGAAAAVTELDFSKDPFRDTKKSLDKTFEIIRELRADR
ncbi:MAG: sugar phosphate isomerase/epimerase [Clostridiales bacterium]|jgi:sugar phosphate isomerase/epimerase|nr:sugar phosphate isomerase/epimerase [Clostridiales bacterium]